MNDNGAANSQHCEEMLEQKILELDMEKVKRKLQTEVFLVEILYQVLILLL